MPVTGCIVFFQAYLVVFWSWFLDLGLSGGKEERVFSVLISAGLAVLLAGIAKKWFWGRKSCRKNATPGLGWGPYVSLVSVCFLVECGLLAVMPPQWAARSVYFAAVVAFVYGSVLRLQDMGRGSAWVFLLLVRWCRG